MIYEGGTSTGNFQALSYGGDVGVVGTGGRTKSQSLLAQKVQPPRMPKTGCSEGILAIIAFFAGSIIFAVLLKIVENSLGYELVPPIGGVLTLAAGIAGVLGTYKYFNDKVSEERKFWQIQYRQWQSSWMCLKCGATYQLN